MAGNQSFTEFQDYLQPLGFTIQNQMPSGGESITGPLRISYNQSSVSGGGQGRNVNSPENAWTLVQQGLQQHNIGYTGPVEITVNGKTQTFQYSGKQMGAGSS